MTEHSSHHQVFLLSHNQSSQRPAK